MLTFTTPLILTLNKPSTLLHPKSSTSTLKMTTAATSTQKVLIYGATGRSGRLVTTLLHSTPNFTPIAFIRDTHKATQTLSPEIQTTLGDVLDKDTVSRSTKDIDYVVVLSSAVPMVGENGEFYYLESGYPEMVDWQGGVNIIESAKMGNVKRVVYVGSMGSTEENNMLNKIGGGNILKWKRRAEEFLIESGVDYTIINPGGLINEKGGERELVTGKMDGLKKIFGKTVVPREDVARVVVEALKWEKARNKAFDLIAKEVGEGSVTTDFKALFEKTTGGLE